MRTELAAGAGRRIYGVPFFTSLEEYLAHGPAADVLTVATPNGLHAPQAIAGLRHGLHVVVEKPMALRTSRCRADSGTQLPRRAAWCLG